MKHITRIVVGALPTDLNADSKAEFVKKASEYLRNHRFAECSLVVLTEDLKYEEEFKKALNGVGGLELHYCSDIEHAFNLIKEEEHADKDVFLFDSYFNIENLPSSLASVNAQVLFHFSEDGTVNTESVVGVKASLENKPSNAEMIFLYNDLIGNKPDPANLKQIRKQMDIILSEFNELQNAISAYDALMQFSECHRGAGWSEVFDNAYQDEPWFRMYKETSEGATTWIEAVQSQYTEIRDGCCDVDVTVGGLRHQMGWYPDADLAEVNASNMSKFSTSDDELKATLDHYKELGLEVEVVTTGSEMTGQTHSVRSKETKHIAGIDYRAGKQVKPPHYFKPNFQAIDVTVPLVLDIPAEEPVPEEAPGEEEAV